LLNLNACNISCRTEPVNTTSSIQALNKDFRYQLTCLCEFAPVYVAQKISSNTFEIAGGKPGQEISWQVTGVRKDAFAEMNRVKVEVDKPEAERGTYRECASLCRRPTVMVHSVPGTG